MRQQLARAIYLADDIERKPELTCDLVRGGSQFERA